MAELLGQAGRRGVAVLLGQARVPGDVEEAHRRGVLEPAVESGRGELHLEPVDDAGGPGSRLLDVVHRDHGLLRQDAHPVAEVDAQDLVGPHAGAHRGLDHLRYPRRRLGLGDPAHAVALGADQLLDRGRPEPAVELRLDHGDVRQLRVADAVIGLGRDGAGRLADGQEQFDRHAGLLGQLGEGGAAGRPEPLERGRIEEVEADLAAVDRRDEAVEGDARIHEALDEPRATQEPRREPVVRVGSEDAEIDQEAQLIEADAGALGRLGEVVGLHRATVAVLRL